MSYDCVDVCDAVVNNMCGGCPHYKECQGDDSEAGDANHKQMVHCINNYLVPAYPMDVEYPMENQS